jgi:hypothetical protein
MKIITCSIHKGSTLDSLLHTWSGLAMLRCSLQFFFFPHAEHIARKHNIQKHFHRLVCILWYLMNKDNSWQKSVFFIFFYLHSGGWSPNWVHLARRPFIGLLYLPRVIVRMENLVQLMAGETEALVENLPRRHFVHHKSHLTRPGIEPGPPRWEASD